MGKKSDKDYITYSEWTNEFGGAKSKLNGEGEFKRLPFYCCNLSLRPIEGAAVCTLKGEIFDFMQIIPYLRRNNNTHPFRPEEELNPSDLFRVNFHRNNETYSCPITRKTLNENTKIVVNKKSGNVYAWETVENLNIKRGNWKDLITEESFTKDDLIILQDPQNPKDSSTVFKKFNSLKGTEEGEKISDKVNLTGGIGKVLKDLKMADIRQINTGDDDNNVTSAPSALHAVAAHSTGKLAASLTSTSVSIKTKNEFAILDEAETLSSKYFHQGRETNGTVCIRTNFGDLFFTIFASKSPKCSFNFIELAKKGYFDGTQFHRFVKGFILQGGDPTGTGRGGESYWGKPFGERSLHPTLTHNERGILSMANSGDVNSNGSQFFITLRSTPHLNGKHAIFGKLLSGANVLDAIEEEVDVDTGHKPLKPIIIEDVFVLEDPFEEAKKEALRIEASTKAISANAKNENFAKPQLEGKKSDSKIPQIGKYLVTKNRKNN